MEKKTEHYIFNFEPGSLIGIALVAAIVFQYNLAFLILAGAALLGLASAFWVKKKNAPEGAS